MDANMETTTTQSGRQTKAPAKFQQNGSLGAAVSGGGLSTTPKLLPGITGSTPPTTEGAAATNTQSEDGGIHLRPVETTAAGKGKTRANILQAILNDPQFSDEACGPGNEDGNSSASSDQVRVGDDSNNSDDSGAMIAMVATTSRRDMVALGRPKRHLRARLVARDRVGARAAASRRRRRAWWR